MNEELEKLYKAVSAHFDIGTFDDFSAKMQTPEQRKSFYDSVGKNGFDLGDYQQFESRLNQTNPTQPEKKKETATVSPSVSENGNSSSASKQFKLSGSPNQRKKELEKELFQSEKSKPKIGEEQVVETRSPQEVKYRENVAKKEEEIKQLQSNLNFVDRQKVLEESTPIDYEAFQNEDYQKESDEQILKKKAPYLQNDYKYDSVDFQDNAELTETLPNLESSGFNERDVLAYMNQNALHYVDLKNKGIVGDKSQMNEKERIISDMQTYKAMRNYVADRQAYLWEKARANEGNPEVVSKAMEEFNSISNNLQSWANENLPDYVAFQNRKADESAKKYLDNKEGKSFDNIEDFTRGMGLGLENFFMDTGAVVADALGADKLAENIRTSKEYRNIEYTNPLTSYVYEQGKEVEQNGQKFLVTSGGRILDTESKVDVTNIADRIGLDTEQLLKDAESSDIETSSFSFRNSFVQGGAVIGNLVPQIVGTKGIGSALGGSAAAMRAGGAITAGGMMYATTYEESLATLREYGIDDETAKHYASEAGISSAIVTGLSSIVAYNPQALKALRGSKPFKEAIKDFANVARKEGVDVAKKNLSQQVVKILGDAAGEGSVEILQENLEGFMQTVKAGEINVELGREILNQEYGMSDIVTNSVLSFAVSGMMAAVGSGRDVYSQGEILDMYDLAAKDVNATESVLNDYVKSGFINEAEKKNIFTKVQNYTENISKVPSEYTPEQKLQAVDLLAQKTALENRKKNIDSAFHDEINEQIQAVDEQIKAIRKPKVDDKTTNKEEEVTPTQETFVDTDGKIKPVPERTQAEVEPTAQKTQELLKENEERRKRALNSFKKQSLKKRLFKKQVKDEDGVYDHQYSMEVVEDGEVKKWTWLTQENQKEQVLKDINDYYDEQANIINSESESSTTEGTVKPVPERSQAETETTDTALEGDPDLVNIDPTIQAARNGDKQAQQELEQYGVEWEQTTTYRFVGQSEVDVLLANEKVNSKRGMADAGIDVTTSPKVTSAANNEYRVTFKESFDVNNGLGKVKAKNRELGDHNLERGRGYDINDVAKIERLDENGNVVETVYDANATSTSQSEVKPTAQETQEETQPSIEDEVVSDLFSNQEETQEQETQEDPFEQKLAEENSKLQNIIAEHGEESRQAKAQQNKINVLQRARQSETPTTVSLDENNRPVYEGKGKGNPTEERATLRQAAKEGLYDNVPETEVELFQGMTEEDVDTEIARTLSEKGENPRQIVEHIQRLQDKAEENRNDTEGSKLEQIWERLKGGVSLRSFQRFGDRNNLPKSVIATFNVSSKNDANNLTHLDIIAEELGVTENELVEFMLNFPNRQALEEALEIEKDTPEIGGLKARFEEITGMKATPQNMEAFTSSETNQQTDNQTDTQVETETQPITQPTNQPEQGEIEAFEETATQREADLETYQNEVFGETVIQEKEENVQEAKTQPKETKEVKETLNKSEVEATAKALEGVDIPVNTPIKGLSVRMTDLKIAEENLAKGKKSVTPNAPVDVTINLTTGERELSDGYHRYLDARGGTIEAAKTTNLDGTIPAKINFEINEKSGGFIKPRKATNQEISEAYHKAKADGSNPELVKAVEDLIGKPKQQRPSPSNTKQETNETLNKSELEDVGEKIGGARKDLAQSLKKVNDDDLSDKPLSQIFPRPDFNQLVKDGILTKEAATLLSYLYDNLPAKPRLKHRKKAWVGKVRTLIDTMEQLLNDENQESTARTMSESLASYDMRFTSYAKTIEALGEITDLKGYAVREGIDGRVFITKESAIVADGFKSFDEAAQRLKEILSKPTPKRKGTTFGVWSNTVTGEVFIGKKAGRNINKVMSGFKTVEDARKYLKENQAELDEIWDKMKTIADERRSENAPRVGPDYRKGKNVSSKDFKDTFGFRGVEFGNWVNTKERQAHVNEAYDALMDLAHALNIDPRALSLNGQLAFAFGARGKGKANAHYEKDKVVINLTKTKGAGSLAHEWWHALDNYLSRMRGKDMEYLTERPRRLIDQQKSEESGEQVMDDSVRVEIILAIKGIVEAINKSGLAKRSDNLDKTRSKPYWGTMIEMTARAFENFIIQKLSENAHSNDYLANLQDLEGWVRAGMETDNYPYPNQEESQSINEAIQHLFDIIQQKETEDGNVALFQRGTNTFKAISKKAFKGLVNRLNRALGGKNKIITSEKEFRNALKKAGLSEAQIQQMVDVWHGSPHKFDKFSTEFIGAGEGAQRFGWGLYFTDLKSIGEDYATKLSQGLSTSALSDSKPLPESAWEEISPIMRKYNIAGDISPNQTEAGFVREIINNNKDRLTNEELNTLEKYAEESNRNLYKASLHKGKTPDQYTWLEWDKPIPEATISKLEKLFEGKNRENVLRFTNVNGSTGYRSKQYRSENKGFIAPTGKSVYTSISQILGSDKAASLFLLENGIDGIKYPEGTISRGTTSETARGFNYVVFDENAITIEEHIQFMQDSSGTIFGAVLPDGTIYLNENTLNANTPFHEIIGHLFLNNLKKTNPKAHKEIIEKLKAEKALMDQVRNDPAYAHLTTDEQIADELFARMVGDKGEQLFNQMQSRSLSERIKSLIDKFWQNIKKWIGTQPQFKNIKNWTAEQFRNATIGDIIDNLTKEALAGKQIISELVNEPQSNEVQYAQFLQPSDFDKNGNVKPEVLEEIRKEEEQIKAEAQANGTWMKAPNGENTNLNEDQWVTVRTKRFKDWFGDWINDPENASKVVDENGEPMVVYHGTVSTQSYDSIVRNGFNVNERGLIFLSPNKSTSVAFSDGTLQITENNDSSLVFSLFANAKNIFDGEFPSEEIIQWFADNADLSDYITSRFAKDSDYYNAAEQALYDKQWDIVEFNEFTEFLKSKGYDGLMVFNTLEVNNNTSANLQGENSIAVFSPNQIKSATDNVGTFSNESNNIRLQASSNNFSNFNENKTDDGLTYVSEKNTKYQQTSLQFDGQESTDDGIGSDNLQQEEISGQGLGASVVAVWNKVKHLNFTGGQKVTSHKDVAHIMRLLENKSVEHAFAVHIDQDGNAHIQHLSIGGVSATIMDANAIFAGVKKFNSKKVYFVHNHPSGTLKPSDADIRLTEGFISNLGNAGIQVEHVIMDTYKKQYVVIDNYANWTVQDREEIGDNIPYETHIMDEQKVLSQPVKIKTASDIINFIQAARFSAVPKNGVLLLNNSLEIVGNFILGDKIEYRDLLNKIGESATVTSIVFYGNQNNTNEIQDIKYGLKQLNINVLDHIIITQTSPDVEAYYKSASEEGLLREVQSEYGTNNQVNDPGSLFSSGKAKPVPVKVAKEMIEIMKEVAGFTNNSRTIFDAGIDFIKTTEWYESLSPELQAQVDTPTFRNAVGQMVKSLNASTKKINDLKNKIKSEKQTKKEAVKTITDFLNSNDLPKKHITETELKRLMRRAAEVATYADMEKAIERFQEVYEKIMMNAEARETAGKKETPVREQVDTMLASGMSEDAIIDSFESKKDKDIAKDQINRSKPATKKEALDKWNKAKKEYDEKLKFKVPAFKAIKRRMAKLFTDRQFTIKSLLGKSGMRRSGNLLINARGASGYAENMFKDAYDAIWGVKWNQKPLNRNERKALDDIIFLRRIVEIDNNREAKGLPPIMHTGEMTGSRSQLVLDDMKDKLGAKQWSKLNKRADIYFHTFRQVLKDKYDAGFLTKEAYDEISKLDYSPRKLLGVMLDFNGDAKETKDITKKLQDNGIKSFDEGSMEAFVKQGEFLLQNAISSAYKNIARNKVANMIFREIEKSRAKFERLDAKVKAGEKLSRSDKDFYEAFQELSSKIFENPVIGTKKDGSPKYKYKETPKNFTEAFRWVDGKRKSFFVEDNLHAELMGETEAFIQGKARDIIPWFTGSALIKYFATGNNPAFFIANTPRDATFNYINSNRYSSIPVVGQGQSAYESSKALLNIAKSELNLGESLVDKLFEYGLSMEWLSTQGRLKKTPFDLMPPNVRDVLKKSWGTFTAQKLQTANELMFRVAIAQKVVANFLNKHNLKSVNDITDSVAQANGYIDKQDMLDDMYESAVREARGILDFSRGGLITKDLELFIPYTNVAAQSLDKVAEMWMKKPLQTFSKTVQVLGTASVGTIATGLMVISMMRADDDEEDKDKPSAEILLDTIDGLSVYERTNYSHIPLGRKDEHGNYMSIRIAKEHALTPLFVISDYYALNYLRRQYGRPEEDISGLKTRLSFALRKNLTTVSSGPTDLMPPTMTAIATYASGYDFFREQQLQGTDATSKFRTLPKKAEGIRSPYVEEFWKEIGEEHDLSPVRTKAAFESIFTSPSTSPLIGLMYGGADLAWSKDKTMTEVKEDAAKSLKKAFTGRIIKSSSDYNRTYQERMRLKKLEDDVRFQVEKRDAAENDLIRKRMNNEISKEDFTKEANLLRPGQGHKLELKFNERKANKKLPNEILNIKYAETVDERVEKVYHYYGDIFAAENKEALRELIRAKGIVTDSFIVAFKKKTNALKEQSK